jgi:uncharacterized protein YpmS
MALLITILLPTAFLLYLAKRFFSLKEKQLELNAREAAEKAAEYATNNSQLEQRVRVLEQIVTDRGAETAAQIDALRKRQIEAPVRRSEESLG